MISFTHLNSAIDNERHATSEHNELMLHILTTMAEKIHQLELQAATSNELLAQLRDGEGDQLQSFDERVLNVLDVRSGTAFSHIEAEIDDKLCEFTESHCFHESVAESVQESLHGIVEEMLKWILPDAINDHLGDAEDIVRKGLRSIL